MRPTRHLIRLKPAPDSGTFVVEVRYPGPASDDVDRLVEGMAAAHGGAVKFRSEPDSPRGLVVLVARFADKAGCEAAADAILAADLRFTAKAYVD